MFRRATCLAVAMAALLVPVLASGQNTTVSGVVKSETQSPVRGAFVQIASLNLSTVTNDNGIYSIVIPAARATGTVSVRFSSIGYKTVEVQIALRPGRVAQDAMMAEEAVSLDEVVVTGTAGRQERRAQPAVVATISAQKVAEVAPVQSVANLLQARTPGVMIRNTSGSSGTASTIRIRGQGSIELGNDPLVFIDGIRADGGTRSVGVSTQSGSALNDIKIEDIESVEIVKGPAAATLYGSDANAGVINIITKRGRQASGFTQSVTVEYGRADPNFTPPNNYQTCTAGLSATGFPGCVGKAVGTVVGPDNPLLREKSFGDAVGKSVQWNLRGGGERYGVFLSAGADNESGTLPNNEFGHMNARASFDFFASEKMRLELGFAIQRTATQLPNNDNDIYGYLGGGLLGDPRTIGAPKDGWYGNNRQTTAISSIENADRTLRVAARVHQLSAVHLVQQPFHRGWRPSARPAVQLPGQERRRLVRQRVAEHGSDRGAAQPGRPLHVRLPGQPDALDHQRPACRPVVRQPGHHPAHGRDQRHGSGPGEQRRAHGQLGGARAYGWSDQCADPADRVLWANAVQFP